MGHLNATLFRLCLRVEKGRAGRSDVAHHRLDARGMCLDQKVAHVVVADGTGKRERVLPIIAPAEELIRLPCVPAEEHHLVLVQSGKDIFDASDAHRVVDFLDVLRLEENAEGAVIKMRPVIEQPLDAFQVVLHNGNVQKRLTTEEASVIPASTLAIHTL